MNLKELRAQHVPPLTQQQLAAAVGVTLRCVQAWESGARSIDRADLDTLCMAAQVLHCQLYDLIQSPELVKNLLEVTQNDNL